jgi:AP-3 complex subunit beta
LLATGYPDEATETKMQIMNLAIKLSLRLPEDENVQSLMTYVLEMSRYDLDTDLRDRSRFMTALMGLAPSNENEGTGEASAVDEEALEVRML